VIAVIIPYFQREPGILTRALRSVAAQRDLGVPVHVIVVDDASPVPAAGEISGISLPAGMTLAVVTQPNAGPGAARNRGLDSVLAGTRYVAFLDSDDEWAPRHLARAKAALDDGHDLFFADHLQLGSDKPAFVRAGRLDLARHRALAHLGPGLFHYEGDLFHQVLSANVIGTSTVVYRYAGRECQRFRVELTTAGEDYLFWMELCRSGARAAFSTEVAATYGRGVNVYARSGWGTDGFALRVHNEARYKQLTLQLFDLSAGQVALQRSAVRRLREAFADDVMHRLLHRKPLNWTVLRSQVRHDPWTLAALAAWIPRRLVKRLGGRGAAA
jgi:succinoglycan biosynthesis protein ExoW